MVNKTNWNCSLRATKPTALRGGSSTTSTAPTGPWEEQRGVPLLLLVDLNDKPLPHWPLRLPFRARLAYSYPLLLAGSVERAVLRKQKEALRLDANIGSTVGLWRPPGRVAFIDHSLHNMCEWNNSIAGIQVFTSRTEALIPHKPSASPGGLQQNERQQQTGWSGWSVFTNAAGF